MKKNFLLVLIVMLVAFSMTGCNFQGAIKALMGDPASQEKVDKGSSEEKVSLKKILKKQYLIILMQMKSMLY